MRRAPEQEVQALRQDCASPGRPLSTEPEAPVLGMQVRVEEVPPRHGPLPAAQVLRRPVQPVERVLQVGPEPQQRAFHHRG